MKEKKDNILVKLRNERELHQYEVAWALDVTPGAYSNYERETRPFPMYQIRPLANLYGLSPFFLWKQLAKSDEFFEPEYPKITKSEKELFDIFRSLDKRTQKEVLIYLRDIQLSSSL